MLPCYRSRLQAQKCVHPIGVGVGVRRNAISNTTPTRRALRVDLPLSGGGNHATTAGAGFAAAISLISLVTAMLSILPVPSIGSFSM